MKKSIIALAALAALSVASSSIAAPAPQDTQIRFECPNASGGVVSERITNYGSYLAGMGEENISGSKTRPIFKGIPALGVPADLSVGGYVHAGAFYNNTTGRITCVFNSTLGFPSFNVSYVATNAINGLVVKAENSKITVVLPQGIK